MVKIFSLLSSLKILAVNLTIIIILLIYDTLINRGEPVIKSYLFSGLNIILFLNIFSCVFLRFLKKIKMSLSFILIHLGLLVVIAGFILSSVLSFEANVFLKQKEEVVLATDEKGDIFRLPFRIRLKDFNIEYYKQPKPVIVTKEGKIYDCADGVEIEVNKKVYRIEKFFNDFVIEREKKFSNRTPFYNNPAVLVSYKDKTKKENFWVFYNNSNTEQPFQLKLIDNDVKDYISDVDIIYEGREYNAKISVNNPLSFFGYKIYQTGFEPSEGKSTVLTVKKDNFVWVVFAGFFILGAGVVLWII